MMTWFLLVVLYVLVGALLLRYMEDTVLALGWPLLLPAIVLLFLMVWIAYSQRMPRSNIRRRKHEC